MPSIKLPFPSTASEALPSPYVVTQDIPHASLATLSYKSLYPIAAAGIFLIPLQGYIAYFYLQFQTPYYIVE